MSHLPLRSPDDDLLPVIRNADNDDLGILVDFIMKASSNELDSCPAFKSENPKVDGKRVEFNGNHKLYADDIAAEIQKFGGNSIINLFRGGQGVPYAEVVRDVADKLNVSYGDHTEVAAIELQIQLKVVEKAYEKMTDEERIELLDTIGADHKSGIPAYFPTMAMQAAIKLSGFAAYKLALIVANSIARILLGRGLSFATNAALARAIGAFAGPIGWAITAIWAIFDIAGPAYRVTIPCVLQVAYMRQKAMIDICPNCKTEVSKSVKFCPECGASLKE